MSSPRLRSEDGEYAPRRFITWQTQILFCPSTQHLCELVYFLCWIWLSLFLVCSKTYRTMIFNGDVDGCVPFIGNEVHVQFEQFKQFNILCFVNYWAVWKNLVQGIFMSNTGTYFCSNGHLVWDLEWRRAGGHGWLMIRWLVMSLSMTPMTSSLWQWRVLVTW